MSHHAASWQSRTSIWGLGMEFGVRGFGVWFRVCRVRVRVRVRVRDKVRARVSGPAWLPATRPPEIAVTPAVARETLTRRSKRATCVPKHTSSKDPLHRQPKS